jgi:hypothetical protein
MSFFDWLLRRKPKGRHGGSTVRVPESEPNKATADSGGAGSSMIADRFPKLTDSAPEVLTRTQDAAPVAKDTPTPAMNIWDMEPEPDATPQMARDAGTESAPRRRPTRTKTRVLGFEPQLASVVPLFDEGRMDEEGEPGSKANMVMFPTGWLIVKAGAGRGAVFPLAQGVSQIGRGTDQTVALDFGDMAISRQNHAAIAYDATTHAFHIGHGGKSNLVRLNGKPLLSTESLEDGDEIQIGETTLVLKVLCTPEFNWSAAEAGGDGHDMAIA